MRKKKKLKHFLIMLAAVLFISTPSSVFANSQDTVNTPTILNIDGKKETLKTIQDDENVRIVESVNEAGKKSVATFDKVKNTMLVENDGEVPVFIDLSKAVELKGQIDNDEIKAGTMASVVSQYTFTNYEYEITQSSPKKWKIFRPKGNSAFDQYFKQTNEGTHNKEYLTSFKKTVDRIDGLEKTAIGLCGTALFLTVVMVVATAGIATPAAYAALGVVGADIPFMINLDSAQEDAEYWYEQV